MRGCFTITFRMDEYVVFADGTQRKIYHNMSGRRWYKHPDTGKRTTVRSNMRITRRRRSRTTRVRVIPRYERESEEESEDSEETVVTRRDWRLQFEQFLAWERTHAIIGLGPITQGMDETPSDSDVFRDTPCAVCMEDYAKIGPHRIVTLGCTHTICALCYNRLYQTHKLKCPTCREEIQTRTLTRI